MGCNEEEIREPESAPGALNASIVQIPAGEVVSGFKHGQLRTTFDVARFSISKQPITVEQFGACVSAGACAEPRATCGNLDGAADDVALCVGLDNARAYCSWSGGRLPALNEWLLAARGQSPQRFAWGDSAPSCQQHPLAHVPLRDRDSEQGLAQDSAQTECGEKSEKRLRVGRHEAGASSHGLEDVLLANAELVIGHRATNFGACRNPSDGCLVYGLLPGAIDSVKTLQESTETRTATATVTASDHAYAFRCVWSGEGA